MPDVAKNARQQLAEVLKFHREERKFDLTKVANLTQETATTVLEWERGTAIPGARAWDRLKHIVHPGLKAHEDLWRKARTEEEYERTQAKTQVVHLTQKPFAGLKLPQLTVVKDSPKKFKPPPPPVTRPIVVPENFKPLEPKEEMKIPENLLGEGYDLQAAYIAVNELPKGWNTRLASEERADYARELLKQGMTTQEVVLKVREKFKVGISGSTIASLREELKEAGKLQTPPPVVRVREPDPVPEPTQAPPPAPVDVPTIEEREIFARLILKKSPSIQVQVLDDLLKRKFGEALPAERTAAIREELKKEARGQGQVTITQVQKPIKVEDLKAAVEMLIEALPGLATFTVTVSEAGDVKIDYKVRETRVETRTVETGGSLKL